jgi:hypothetical protein
LNTFLPEMVIKLNSLRPRCVLDQARRADFNRIRISIAKLDKVKTGRRVSADYFSTFMLRIDWAIFTASYAFTKPPEALS